MTTHRAISQLTEDRHTYRQNICTESIKLLELLDLPDSLLQNFY